MKNAYAICLLVVAIWNSKAQEIPTSPPKVHHAEPLFYDLVRDLGARKGEKEFNVGANFTPHSKFNEQAYLIEYEFAPIDRLGLEFEANLSLYSNGKDQAQLPGNKLEALRFSSQYSFLVAPKHQTTLAVGYTQIVEFTAFENYGKSNLVSSTVYSPFFIAGKGWGKNWHSLFFTYPLIEQSFAERKTELAWALNTSLHYILPRTGHFVGLECNQEIRNGKFLTVLRPQVKVEVTDSWAVGLVTGFPLNEAQKNVSTFVRLIYEL